MTQEELFKKLVAHCKEYGFVFPSSEIYDGLGAVYDYGQNGVELKNNIKQLLVGFDGQGCTRTSSGIDACDLHASPRRGRLRATWRRSTTR